MISAGLLLLSLLASSYALENDWRKPCLDGVCYYDLPPTTDGSGSAGTIKIWGSSEAITDVTPAAGWEILDCDKNALNQQIRVVCTGDAKCRHLFGRKGAKGKIVRLPESCGRNAFARIRAARPSKNRSIPAVIADKIERRVGVEPDIQELEIDTNFANAGNVDGNVYFSVIGTNTQTVSEEEVKNELEPRGWDVDKSHTIPLFSYHNAFTLVDQSLTCGAINGNFRIGGNVDADFTVTLGITAEGSFFPPDVDEFKAYARLNGAVSGAMDLSAGLSGSWSTGRRMLFEKVIGGIDFAGIISVGPSIGIATSVDANFGISANIHAGFNWQLVNAQVYFPAGAGQSGPGFQLGTAPLQLTITPTASATASIEAHVIPIVALKIEALGVADARVYVDVDASARAVADVSVSGAGGITIPVGKSDAKAIEERQFTYTYGGCIDVDAGLDINFGADAKFFGIFDKSKVIDLYTKNWDIYNQCFGDRKRTAAARRDSWARSINASANIFERGIEQRGLACTINNNNASPVTVVNTNVNGAGAVPK